MPVHIKFLHSCGLLFAAVIVASCASNLDWPQGGYDERQSPQNQNLIFERARVASQTPLGTQEDVDQLKNMAKDSIEKAKGDTSTFHTTSIRWIDADLAMVFSSWRNSPTSARVYYQVFEKRWSAWRLVGAYWVGNDYFDSARPRPPKPPPRPPTQ